MTKKELIEKLKEVPDDAPIYFLDMEFSKVLEVDVVSFVTTWNFGHERRLNYPSNYKQENQPATQEKVWMIS